jgi:cytochrome c551/c552
VNAVLEASKDIPVLLDRPEPLVQKDPGVTAALLAIAELQAVVGQLDPADPAAKLVQLGLKDLKAVRAEKDTKVIKDPLVAKESQANVGVLAQLVLKAQKVIKGASETRVKRVNMAHVVPVARVVLKGQEDPVDIKGPKVHAHANMLSKNL